MDVSQVQIDVFVLLGSTEYTLALSEQYISTLGQRNAHRADCRANRPVVTVTAFPVVSIQRDVCEEGGTETPGQPRSAGRRVLWGILDSGDTVFSAYRCHWPGFRSAGEIVGVVMG